MSPLVATLIFYDVTTLYFESFTDDELRKCGFSKDHKAGQPQIVVSLVVDRQGFPLGFDLFEGDKFEGHTFIPTILKFKQTHQITSLTVVADAGMLSETNMQSLVDHGLTYVVGARVANLGLNTIEQISTDLSAQENKYVSVQTKLGKLICDYSKSRAAKNKSDRLKQLQRAKEQLDNPQKLKRKSRFIKTTSRIDLTLNQELVRKDELLEGVKGYYTNLTDVDEQTIVARYKDLWHVEKSFRMAKSDLQARPIFHHKRSSIEAHLLIVFISLCLAKAMEMATGVSIKKITDILWTVHDVELTDCKTGDKYHKRTDYTSKSNNEVIHKLHHPIQTAY
jgi:transposase